MIKYLRVALAAAIMTLAITGIVTRSGSNARFFIFATLFAAMNIVDIVDTGTDEDVEEPWMKHGFGIVLMSLGSLFLLSTAIFGGTFANVAFLCLLLMLTSFLKAFPPWSSKHLRRTKTGVSPPGHARQPRTRDSGVKSFLLLFFKKEGLSSSLDQTTL